MPGSSLWLLPPDSHPLHRILTTLITSTLPSTFPREASATSPGAGVAPHYFPAHVTLTSGIEPDTTYGDEPQRWLDAIPFPIRSEKVRVRFERVVSQDVFFRRCFVRVAFDGVREVAGVARAVGVLGEQVNVDGEGEVRWGEGTQKWLSEWREEFGPHLSLMYGDEPIADEALKQITKVVREAGVKLSEEITENIQGTSGWDGWDGGVIWLVPTDKPISEWGKPIATRQL
ncbi:2, 3 cyclic phosphodiesterase [Parathielavia appendiculata]|uniref:2, 3 cyclic phosphodiesterase n=1 Tax=Parathielavia appendiculata TaxID=2587402 RepID=A0AAN6Z7C3_9PEZI|nr:2, 3 cyclic phosphodiesterase [Parathielavia appendiculata]